MYMMAVTLNIVLLVLSFSATAQTNQWEPVTGTETLREFMGGLTAERTLPNGEVSRGEYKADGTGTLHAWGATLPRTWSVKADDQLCVTEKRNTLCYTLERDTADSTLYRVLDVSTGQQAEFRVTDGRGIVKAEPKEIGNQGGAAAASADELAAELSNPNTAVASLTIKNQFRTFKGDLPDANDQASYTLLFQPSLPFVLESGNKILWRPAVPILVDQPVPNSDTGELEGKAGLGDIAFDLAYAPVTNTGLLIAYGVITSLPMATNDLGTKRWTLGPELLLGKITKQYVLGIFPNHQWSIGGPGNKDVNLTTIQAFYTHLPGGGWSVGTGPIMTYDWEGEQWTVPLQLNAGKTLVFSGRPWKFSAELNYYVEKSDALGPEWMISLNVAPVVKNGLASWFGL